MKLSLINLEYKELNKSIMYDYIHNESNVVLFNANLSYLDNVDYKCELFLNNKQYDIEFKYERFSRIYYCSRGTINIPNSINIYPYMIESGINISVIENSSDILLFAIYYKLKYMKIESIIFKGFDFGEDKDYIRHKSLNDLSLLERLITLHNGNLNSEGSKYFNLLALSLRNKILNKDEDIDFIELSSISNEELNDLCNNITSGVIEKKCFITITSKGYEWGTIALCQSIAEHHFEPVIILYSDNIDIELIKENVKSKIYLRKVPNLQISENRKTAERYFNTLTKFFILGLEPIERLVYLDSDMILLNSLDDYLNSNEELYCSYTYEHPILRPKMAVSIISIKPNHLLMSQFINNAIKNPSGYSGIGDHGYFINYYKDNWTFSDMESNLSQMFFGNTGNSVPDYGRAIHYHGFKPWERVVGRGVYLSGSNIHKVWYNKLSKESLVNLIAWFRKNEAIKEADNTLNRYLNLIK
ncbi:TPA: hypothetical protein ACK3JJ_000802 [Mannheimia haemolytica]